MPFINRCPSRRLKSGVGKFTATGLRRQLRRKVVGNDRIGPSRGSRTQMDRFWKAAGRDHTVKAHAVNLKQGRDLDRREKAANWRNRCGYFGLGICH